MADPSIQENFDILGIVCLGKDYGDRVGTNTVGSVEVIHRHCPQPPRRPSRQPTLYYSAVQEMP
jgi:hypothetical protein